MTHLVSSTIERRLTMSVDLSKTSLVEATPEQDEIARKRNYLEWARGLDLEGYLRRDMIVDAHEHATNGRLKTWVLAPVDNPTTLDFFCACETFQRQALIQRSASTGPEKVTAYAISSVFCPPGHRRKGYTTHMMRLIHHILAPANVLGPFPEEWGSPPVRPAGAGDATFSMLWSEIGGDIYKRAGPNPSRSGWEVKRHINTIWQYKNMAEHLGRVRLLSEADCVKIWEEDALFVEKKFSEKSQELEQTTCAFLPNQGLAAFQIRRATMYLPGSPHLPIPAHWGVKTLEKTETAYATWVTDINHSPASLAITRLRATERSFPVILSAAMDAAKENRCSKVEIWDLDPSLKKVAKDLGGEEVEDTECLPSLAWYGLEESNDIKFLFNERYCYC